VSYKRWGNERRGGDVRKIASDLGSDPYVQASPSAEYGIAWLWQVWTNRGEGNSGTAIDEAQAMECLIHALDPDEGATEKGFDAAREARLLTHGR
jgi:hypothetical protein